MNSAPLRPLPEFLKITLLNKLLPQTQTVFYPGRAQVLINLPAGANECSDGLEISLIILAGLRTPAPRWRLQ